MSPRAMSPRLMQTQNINTMGMDEDQMVKEARFRMAENKKRAQLRNLLKCVDDGKTVRADQFEMAAQMAGMNLPPHVINNLRPCTVGSPRSPRVQWPKMVARMELPPLAGYSPSSPRSKQGASVFGGTAMPGETAAVTQRAQATEKYSEKMVDLDPRVREAWKLLNQRVSNNFTRFACAFRRIDEDKSGKLSHYELHRILHEYNFGLPHNVIDQLINIADHDGDGMVDYGEFLHFLKHGVNAKSVAISATKQGKAKDAGADAEHVAQLRQAHAMIKERIENKFGSLNLTNAFRTIDRDKSGTIDRLEMKQMLHEFNLVPAMVPDAVLEDLISRADFDGDGSIRYAEFARLIAANDVNAMKGSLQAGLQQ